MSRPLTPREADVLAWMVDHAAGFDDEDDPEVDAAAQERWRAQVATARAGRPCGCGTCPSIELTDPRGHTPTDPDERIVLQADAPGAMVLLFIDDDQLSYLELAPLDDDRFPVFPPPEDLTTAP